VDKPLDDKPRVLIVDDDHDIRSLLAEYLSTQGMRTEVASDGIEMWRALAADSFDLVVLDLNLPGDDGLSLCRQLRGQGSTVPIIMLTARAEPIDRIVGLEIGADDYIGKPFEPRELAARIRTVLRRGAIVQSPRSGTGIVTEKLRFAGWTLDIAARQLLSPEGTVVVVTSGEYRLLKALVENAGRVLNRDQLLNLTQGRDAGPFDRSIDLQISRLRAKLRDDARSPSLLKTIRNEGYLLASQSERIA